MEDRSADNPKGLLNPQAGKQHFQLSRHSPSPDLRFFVERYWVVEWDLRGQPPYVSENLPFPCVNVVVNSAAPVSPPAGIGRVNPGRTGVYGVVTGKFAYFLDGEGRVFGIKFRPGGFYPFLKSPVSRLTDTDVPFRDIWGPEGDALEAAILEDKDTSWRVACAETFLRECLPEPDKTVAEINDIIDCIIADQAITRVEDVAEKCHLTTRTLQRLFNQYVGVSPKWVIKRYRLHEAAEKLALGQVDDWPTLALSLGYFDQAHFIKDFKSIVGKTPAEYVRRL